MDTSAGNSISNYLVDLCVKTVETAQEDGVVIRALGAVAFRIHTRDLNDLHLRLERRAASGEELSDLDFITYGKMRSKVEKSLEKIGYTPDHATQMLAWLWSERPVYIVPEGKYHADIFFDKLEMCHTVDLTGRLEKDTPTIPLAEMLLEKMQIVQINEKDLKDCTALFVSHDVGSEDRELINGPHIGSVLAKDWGFWYTTTTNLRKLRNYLPKLNLTPEEKTIVQSRIDKLLQIIDAEPKTSAWEKRAKVGTSKKWYRDVEEIG